ncbi:hypothetical protein E2C01_070452 [Portunus trituberculatus]|uniref:Uncharacterized protein n=1 Tax=Portunus trituberculatus TaxID=210409 RepID=A0A5B7HSR3_PORTR|nr:hypothetical protein [Portunus trituberculatus]
MLANSCIREADKIGVRVAVKQSSLAVSVQDGGSAWRTLLDGTLAHPVRAEECLWSLVSAEHVASTPHSLRPLTTTTTTTTTYF